MALDFEKIGLDENAARQPRLWTVDEYYRLGEIGLFDDERVELIGGEIMIRNPRSIEEHKRRWTVDEYYRIAESGLLDGQRVELIDGEIITMSPMAEPHAMGVTNTQYALIDALPRSLIVRVQMPLTLFNGGEPEPDLAVVERRLIGSGQRPSTAALIIEVSDSTLKYDQTIKMNLYAAAGIAEYWILNLQNRRLEIHREPIENATQRFGHRYSWLQNLTPESEVSPLCAPTVSVNVAELLP